MISTTLMVGLGIAGAAIIVALMVRRRRLPADAAAEHARWRDASYTSLLLSLAASIGIARSQDSRPDAAYTWHGSHLDHGAHSSGTGFTDGGSHGGDGGGAGL